MKVQIKRVYEKPSRQDGFRVLVDRLWPRGLSKQTARVDAWMKDIAPTDSLRRWFGHRPERWAGFEKKYSAELAKNDTVELLRRMVKKEKTVTLLFAAKDMEHNNAVVLQALISRRWK